MIYFIIWSCLFLLNDNFLNDLLLWLVLKALYLSNLWRSLLDNSRRGYDFRRKLSAISVPPLHNLLYNLFLYHLLGRDLRAYLFYPIKQVFLWRLRLLFMSSTKLYFDRNGLHHCWFRVSRESNNLRLETGTERIRIVVVRRELRIVERLKKVGSLRPVLLIKRFLAFTKVHVDCGIVVIDDAYRRSNIALVTSVVHDIKDLLLKGFGLFLSVVYVGGCRSVDLGGIHDFKDRFLISHYGSS